MSECKWCDGSGLEYIGEGMSKICVHCQIVVSAEVVEEIKRRQDAHRATQAGPFLREAMAMASAYEDCLALLGVKETT